LFFAWQSFSTAFSSQPKIVFMQKGKGKRDSSERNDDSAHEMASAFEKWFFGLFEKLTAILLVCKSAQTLAHTKPLRHFLWFTMNLDFLMISPEYFM
jgi:hypothetical protein